MAFNVISTHGDADTVKDTDFVRVQTVEVTNKAGDVANRIEARIFVDNPNSGYQGPSKTALAFDKVEQVEDLIAALQEAVANFQPAAAQAAPAQQRVQRVRAKRAVPKAAA
jgi:hypothetical protein